jgi:hypothetical protein
MMFLRGGVGVVVGVVVMAVVVVVVADLIMMMVMMRATVALMSTRSISLVLGLFLLFQQEQLLRQLLLLPFLLMRVLLLPRLLQQLCHRLMPRRLMRFLSNLLLVILTLKMCHLNLKNCLLALHV